MLFGSITKTVIEIRERELCWICDINIKLTKCKFNPYLEHENFLDSSSNKTGSYEIYVPSTTFVVHRC